MIAPRRALLVVTVGLLALLAAFPVGSGAAQAGTPAAVAATPFADLESTLLFETTVPSEERAPADAFLGIYIDSWPVGSGYRRQEGAPGFGIHCVLSGRWVYSLVESAAGAPGTAPTAGTPGPETTLEAGDCLAVPFDAVLDVRNPGPEPLEMLAVVNLSVDYPGPIGRPEQIAGYGVTGFGPDEVGALPPGPIAVAVRRATLAPGAVVAAYTGEGLGIVGSGFESSDLSFGGDGSVRNTSGAPLEVFLLTTRPTAAATDAAATPSPAA